MTSLKDQLAHHHPCGTKVQKGLAQLNSVDQVALLAVRNMWQDEHAPPTMWAAFILALCNTPSDADQVRKACTEVFRKQRLQGDVVESLTGRCLGRVVRWDRFVRFLHRIPSLGLMTTEDADELLQGLLRRPVPEVLARLKDIPLAEHTVWATFSTDGTSPFEGFADSARSLQANLGLSADKPDMTVVCFEYTLPSTMSAHFPTVADAYAGDQWSYYFCPALPGEVYGHTVPWPEYTRARKRPEVVHKPFMLSDLKKPLYMRT